MDKNKPDNYMLIEEPKEEVDRDNVECNRYHQKKEDNLN